MQRHKTKIKLVLIMLLVSVFILPIVTLASNDEMVIVDKEDGNYVIYLKDYLSKEFEFAFSNDKSETLLNFSHSAKDSVEADANNVAYVDDSITGVDFNQPTYMWIKENGEIKIASREISLKDNIKKTELDNVKNVSNTIEILLDEEEIKNETDSEGVKVTVKVGSAKIKDTEYTELSYCLVSKTESKDSENLYDLAELINKNNFTDAYTQIKASKEFTELYNSELSKIKNNNKWLKVENSQVLQPEDTKNGDQYILFLLKDGEIDDAHFLTSFREQNEESVNEKVVTKLPVTYDNNILLIVIAIQIVAILLVIFRVKTLKNKKEM